MEHESEEILWKSFLMKILVESCFSSLVSFRGSFNVEAQGAFKEDGRYLLLLDEWKTSRQLLKNERNKRKMKLL
jgi:hypothetical protein